MEFILLAALLCINCLLFGYQLGINRDSRKNLIERIEQNDHEILSAVADKILKEISGGCNDTIKSKSRSK